MNRRFSSPPDNKGCPTPEEMKEFFTDPLLRKKSNQTKNANPKKTSQSLTDREDTASSDPEAGKPVVKVADAAPIPAANTWMTRRITIAGGFLDIALFTANCEQLKFVLELGDLHIYYRQVAGLLITSLVLQLLFGLTMFLLGCQVFQKVNEDEIYLNFLNHAAMGLVALITIVNIFVGTFGPKGTVMARCLGAFAYPKAYGPVWTEYLNATKNYMGGVN